MICHKPFILTIGDIPKPFETTASLAIARFLDSKLLKISCDEHPNDFLSEFKNRNEEIVQLVGDAASCNSSGGSWLEVLGYWRQPLILLASPGASGDIPGTVSAHVSLCRELSVSLVGIIQLGGIWDSQKRALDCLPWCGFIPEDLLKEGFIWEKANFDEVFLLEDLSMNLKKIISLLSVG